MACLLKSGDWSNLSWVVPERALHSDKIYLMDVSRRLKVVNVEVLYRRDNQVVISGELQTGDRWFSNDVLPAALKACCWKSLVQMVMSLRRRWREPFMIKFFSRHPNRSQLVDAWVVDIGLSSLSTIKRETFPAYTIRLTLWLRLFIQGFTTGGREPVCANGGCGRWFS